MFVLWFQWQRASRYMSLAEEVRKGAPSLLWLLSQGSPESSFGRFRGDRFESPRILATSCQKSFQSQEISFRDKIHYAGAGAGAGPRAGPDKGGRWCSELRVDNCSVAAFAIIMDGRSLKDLTDAQLKEDLGVQELGPRKAIKIQWRGCDSWALPFISKGERGRGYSKGLRKMEDDAFCFFKVPCFLFLLEHLQWYQILVRTARSSLVRFRSSLSFAVQRVPN